MESLNLHSYDGKFSESVYTYVKMFDKTKCLDIDTIIGKIKTALNCSDINTEFWDSREVLTREIERFRNNETDHTNHGLDTHTLLNITWKLCEDNGEQNLFFLQLYDAHITSGWCVQGKCGRCLQVIKALADIN